MAEPAQTIGERLAHDYVKNHRLTGLMLDEFLDRELAPLVESHAELMELCERSSQCLNGRKALSAGLRTAIARARRVRS